MHKLDRSALHGMHFALSGLASFLRNLIFPLLHAGPTILPIQENVDAFLSFRSKIQQATLVALIDSAGVR